MIRIQNQPITFPNMADWLPNPCVLKTDSVPPGYRSVQDTVTGLFMSVQPDGSLQWIAAPRGIYEYLSVDGGFIVASYTYGDDKTAVVFRYPYKGI